MPLINFVTHDGNEYEVDVVEGTSVMQAAVDNGVDAILGECGGACSCATCHCYVDSKWIAEVGQAEGIEKDMLESALNPNENSRLGCQISVESKLDGMIIHLPESQY